MRTEKTLLQAKLLQFIQDGFQDCIKENTRDAGTLIGLPHPYTVPAVGHFDEMYYWDTYFTNVGLILSGRLDQAKHNADNMIYLVKRLGFMPNGNRTYYLNRSQPPFLSMMVREIYDRIQNRSWLEEAYGALTTEYTFWTTKRNTPEGLSHYDVEMTQELVDQEAENFVNRVGIRPDLTKAQMVRHYLTTAESGWDINPRWGWEAYHYVPVELNSLLYALEKNMAYFAGELSLEADAWEQRAALRKQRMLTLMETADGLLMDYHSLRGEKNTILSAAVFYPLLVGLAEPHHAQAVVRNLHRLEAEHGILTCEKNDFPGNYQWDYPNGWACLQDIAIQSLARYGYTEEARRIARKYTALVERVFDKTGNLWEKYNVVDGNIQVVNEYGLPPMMGWSAGVYLAARDFLNKEETENEDRL